MQAEATKFMTGITAVEQVRCWQRSGSAGPARGQQEGAQGAQHPHFLAELVGRQAPVGLEEDPAVLLEQRIRRGVRPLHARHVLVPQDREHQLPAHLHAGQRMALRFVHDSGPRCSNEMILKIF